MSLSKHQQRVRFSLLNLALSIRDDQKTSVQELIADANALNDWVIGVDRNGNNAKGEEINSPCQNKTDIVQNNRIIVLRQLSDGYAALALSVERKNGCNFYTYHDAYSTQSEDDALLFIDSHDPKLIIHNGCAFGLESKFNLYKRYLISDYSLNPFFSKENKAMYKNKQAFAVFNASCASGTSVLSGFSDEVLSCLVSIKESVHKSRPIPNLVNVEFPSQRAGKIIECLFLLFTEKSIKKNWLL